MRHFATEHIEAYYRTAFLGLHQFDREGPARRFGPEPDARWQLFRGHLTKVDRLDLLIRDAAVSHPLAFSARLVFDLAGLTEDDAFGPEWPEADPQFIHDLWRKPPPALESGLIWSPRGGTASSTSRGAASPPQTPIAAQLHQAAEAWHLDTTPPTTPAPQLTPEMHIVAVGAGAIIELAERFAQGSGLDFADQVTAITGHPGERQLLGLAAALLHSARSPKVFTVDKGAPGTTKDAAEIPELKGALDRADLLRVAPHPSPDALTALSHLEDVA